MAIEPLYSLEVACELIPVTYDALLHILSRNPDKFPPRYLEGGRERKRNGVVVDHAGGRPIRMLLESECLAIREMQLRHTKKREGAPATYGRTTPNAKTRDFLGIKIG